jgi:polar amino acid transport system ATP-binding protein
MKVEIENLNFSYSEKKILSNWNLNIDFKSLVLMGPSGCGKSTFLRLLAGLSLPTQGNIKIDGKRLPHSESDLIHYRKKMGIVFQAYNLFPHFNVCTNVALPLFLVHGFTRENAFNKAKEYLNKFGLSEQIYKYPAQLSGGQKQRVALIRAVITDPELLLLDEPTSALDPFMSQEVIDFVSLLIQEKNTPVVLVTHNISFARVMGGKMIFVKDGKAFEVGDTRDLLSASEEECLRKFKV